ncbi:hypothetical protein PROFUN_13730 [Planoprotostelium fungivorum]|uniref:Chromo domain-containing protein n=1 Tax=Planoprotostelium fungivorum TaxID=1890364 RepID=A0A2P6MWV0_9EUKA|nr:hypothetical protein PROFUN_13730 [Planoprotostelium fungivorum]
MASYYEILEKMKPDLLQHCLPTAKHQTFLVSYLETTEVVFEGGTRVKGRQRFLPVVITKSRWNKALQQYQCSFQWMEESEGGEGFILSEKDNNLINFNTIVGPVVLEPVRTGKSNKPQIWERKKCGVNDVVEQLIDTYEIDTEDTGTESYEPNPLMEGDKHADSSQKKKLIPSSLLDEQESEAECGTLSAQSNQIVLCWTKTLQLTLVDKLNTQLSHQLILLWKCSETLHNEGQESDKESPSSITTKTTREDQDLTSDVGVSSNPSKGDYINPSSTSSQSQSTTDDCMTIEAPPTPVLGRKLLGRKMWMNTPDVKKLKLPASIINKLTNMNDMDREDALSKAFEEYRANEEEEKLKEVLHEAKTVSKAKQISNVTEEYVEDSPSEAEPKKKKKKDLNNSESEDIEEQSKQKEKEKKKHQREEITKRGKKEEVREKNEREKQKDKREKQKDEREKEKTERKEEEAKRKKNDKREAKKTKREKKDEREKRDKREKEKDKREKENAEWEEETNRKKLEEDEDKEEDEREEEDEEAEREEEDEEAEREEEDEEAEREEEDEEAEGEDEEEEAEGEDEEEEAEGEDKDKDREEEKAKKKEKNKLTKKHKQKKNEDPIEGSQAYLQTGPNKAITRSDAKKEAKESKGRGRKAALKEDSADVVFPQTKVMIDLENRKKITQTDIVPDATMQMICGMFMLNIDKDKAISPQSFRLYFNVVKACLGSQKSSDWKKPPEWWAQHANDLLDPNKKWTGETIPFNVRIPYMNNNPRTMSNWLKQHYGSSGSGTKHLDVLIDCGYIYMRQFGKQDNVAPDMKRGPQFFLSIPPAIKCGTGSTTVLPSKPLHSDTSGAESPKPKEEQKKLPLRGRRKVNQTPPSNKKRNISKKRLNTDKQKDIKTSKSEKKRAEEKDASEKDSERSDEEQERGREDIEEKDDEDEEDDKELERIRQRATVKSIPFLVNIPSLQRGVITCTPFFANTGLNPRFTEAASKSISDNPNKLAEQLQDAESFARSQLQFAQEEIKKYADRHRTAATKYKPGDQVLLSSENIKTTRPKVKWSDKRLGPYTVIKEVYPNSDSYKLKLPDGMKIHPVFHTSLLTPYYANSFNGRKDPPPQPVMIENNEEYIVERIVDSRQRGRKHKYTEYLVKWQGYDLDPKNNEDWITDTDHCKDALKDSCAILNLHRIIPGNKRKLYITNRGGLYQNIGKRYLQTTHNFVINKPFKASLSKKESGTILSLFLLQDLPPTHNAKEEVLLPVIQARMDNTFLRANEP